MIPPTPHGEAESAGKGFDKEGWEKVERLSELQQADELASKMGVATKEAIDQERVRQFKKWGRQRHSNQTWQTIMLEEFGEVAKAMLEGKPVRQEVIQVIAVGVAWLEDHEERGDNAPELYGFTHEEALQSMIKERVKEVEAVQGANLHG